MRLSEGFYGAAAAATAGLLALVALLLGVAEGYLAVAMIGAVVALLGFFHFFLHSSRAFAFTLANLTGTYACVFLFFVESNFEAVGTGALSAGFVLPLAAFLAGSLWRRRDIASVIAAGQIRDERRFGRVFLWLVPVFGIGTVTFLVPHGAGAAATQLVAFLVAMSVISAVVFAVSHDVAVFLVDTGLLFEEFFGRVARLVIPAFAFLTFYSLLVILFASVYTIGDHLGTPNFRIAGSLRAITFPESLYFSLTTLSTISYGDIAPATSLARFVTAIEIVCGVLLLLFGFNEIFSFAQERRQRPR